MPKIHTFPTLFDEALQIDISKLKQWGYLKSGQIKRGILSWSCNGNPTGSITIKVDNQSTPPFIELNYKVNDEPRRYKVSLVSIPSNLNKGKIWYFLCPQTNKCCRKLYSIDGYFLHREAFSGCMYEKQTHSKKYRWIEKVYGCAFDREKNYEKLNKKHFKKTYAGKPTKKYLKLSQKLEAANDISAHEIEMLMVY